MLTYTSNYLIIITHSQAIPSSFYKLLLNLIYLTLNTLNASVSVAKHLLAMNLLSGSSNYLTLSGWQSNIAFLQYFFTSFGSESLSIPTLYHPLSFHRMSCNVHSNTLTWFFTTPLPYQFLILSSYFSYDFAH